MCGILGIVDFRSKVQVEKLRAASATLKGRGPDDCGEWTQENVGFGHRRLSILDVSASGHQPMLSADQRYVIVLNGEIYNFAELRNSLVNIRWQSESDTETLLEAYRYWGPDCLRRLHGMFAFAIWDRDCRVLFAARDRIGVKPFYYQYSSDGFAFASRPRALLKINSNWSEPLDTQALRFYLECGYIPAPYSIFQNIRKLEPAHYLLLKDHNLSIRRYWDFRNVAPETAWEARREDDLLDELDEIVSRSVRYRMISDVPFGAFLSGGIDSSLVAAHMTRLSARPVKTFTVGFEEKEFDESGSAASVAGFLGTDHYCENLRLDDLLRLFPLFSKEYDEPLYDSSAFPTMAVSRAARAHVTVSLSGDGGDELFGGYSQYQIVRRLEHIYAVPSILREFLGAAVAQLPQHRFKLLGSALRQRDTISAFSFCRSIRKDFDSVLMPEVLNGTVSIGDLFEQTAMSFPDGLSAAEIGMRLDTCYTLPDDYLQKLDLASMAFSLEGREPLLDQDIVEWAMRLPMKWKLRNGTNKYLLRKLAYRYVPPRLIDRPKRGFEVPIGLWLRGPLRTWSEELLTDAAMFQHVPLDRKAVMDIYRLHNSGKRNAQHLMWSVLMLFGFLKETNSSSLDTGMRAVHGFN